MIYFNQLTVLNVEILTVQSYGQPQILIFENQYNLTKCFIYHNDNCLNYNRIIHITL